MNAGKRMQTVYGNIFSELVEMNIGTGLTGHFLNQGLNVLCCLEKSSEIREFKIRREDGGTVYVCPEEQIGREQIENYDIVIIDAPASRFELQLVEKNTEYVNFPYLYEFAKRIKQKSHIYVICFDKYSGISLHDTLIIATGEMLTEENKHVIYPEYVDSLKKAYKRLRKKNRSQENIKLRSSMRTTVLGTCFSQGFFWTDGGQAGKDAENIQTAMQILFERLVDLEGKVESLTNEVDMLEARIRKANEALKKNWDILRLYAEIEGHKGPETDLFIKRLIDKAIDEQMINIECLSATDEYKSMETEICNSMEERIWNKMCTESKQLLVTAKLYQEQLMPYADTIDYSSVCMLASKVFEIELARRFVDGYIAYLKRRGFSKRDFPSGLLVKRQGKITILKAEDFTLGSCPYIMGQVGKNQTEKETNQIHFMEYCKEQLLFGMSEQQIIKWIRKYDSQIRHIKEQFRNPAAHKGIVSMRDAWICFEYLYDSGGSRRTPVLTEMLRDFTN